MIPLVSVNSEVRKTEVEVSTPGVLLRPPDFVLEFVPLFSGFLIRESFEIDFESMTAPVQPANS